MGVMAMIALITADDFESQILQSDQPVLLAGIRQEFEFKEQFEVIKHVSERYHSVLKVCCLEQDLIKTIGRHYKISGTPFYMIFAAGKRQGRLLGKTDETTLTSCLMRFLPRKKGK